MRGWLQYYDFKKVLDEKLKSSFNTLILYRLNHFQSIWHLWQYSTQFYINVVNMGHVDLMYHTIGKFL